MITYKLKQSITLNYIKNYKDNASQNNKQLNTFLITVKRLNTYMTLYHNKWQEINKYTQFDSSSCSPEFPYYIWLQAFDLNLIFWFVISRCIMRSYQNITASNSRVKKTHKPPLATALLPPPLSQLQWRFLTKLTCLSPARLSHASSCSHYAKSYCSTLW